MNNWISSITNPSNKITRKITSFSGSKVNVYPWPIASVVQKVSIKGGFVLNTGPLLGTTVGAIVSSGSPTVQVPSRYGETVQFTPRRISINDAYDGEYNEAGGEYIINPSGFQYLRIDMGANIGPVDIYIDGYESSSNYINLQDSIRATQAKFNRILAGSSSAITSFVKNCTPPTFKDVSLTMNGAVTLSGATHLYLSSTHPFSGMQINLAAEGYTRTKAYTLEYWNGAWTALSTTASTISTWSDADLVFHQSGIITWTKPVDWLKTIVAGDPYLAGSAPYNQNPSGTNLVYDNSLFYVRIVPPTPNAETVPIVSITLFD